MNKTILAMATLISIISTKTYARATTLFECMSGGFAYNELSIVDDNINLHFLTKGNTMIVKSEQLASEYRNGVVKFSIPKDMTFPWKSGHSFKQQDGFLLNTPLDSNIQAKNAFSLCYTSSNT